MIAFFKRWWQARQKAQRTKTCHRFGHMMVRCGEMTPSNKAGVPTGAPEFWMFSCQNRCGHGEINDVGVPSYVRSWDEAEALKKQSQMINPKER